MKRRDFILSSLAAASTAVLAPAVLADDRATSKLPFVGISTGVPWLDQITGGFQPSQFWVHQSHYGDNLFVDAMVNRVREHGFHVFHCVEDMSEFGAMLRRRSTGERARLPSLMVVGAPFMGPQRAYELSQEHQIPVLYHDLSCLPQPPAGVKALEALPAYELADHVTCDLGSVGVACHTAWGEDVPSEVSRAGTWLVDGLYNGDVPRKLVPLEELLSRPLV